MTPRMATQSIRARHAYPKTWREAYGRGLSREEIRLVQAYRGLDASTQDFLLAFASELVITRVHGVMRYEWFEPVGPGDRKALRIHHLPTGLLAISVNH